MGYLVCDKCGGYYKLQPGETPEDFDDECECGGKLTFQKSLEPSIKNSEGLFDKWKMQSKSIKALSIIGVFLIGFLFIGGVMGIFSPVQSTAQPTTPPQVTPSLNNSSTSQVQAGTVVINNLGITKIAHFKDQYNPNLNMNVPIETYSSYVVSGELVPSSNFNYLGVIVKYYDEMGNVLGKNLIWSFNGVKKGENYLMSFEQNVTGTPFKADVMVFDSQDVNDESKAIFKQTINVKK